MLRAVLVGLLAASAVSCKSGGDSPKSQPGVAAGKVVEVTGTVTVRHNDVAQPLAKGATVEGDDVIETGTDGNVIIELSHNLARWELGANKKSKVRESAAWGLAKKSGDVAHVEQDTAAAGRNAERSAADTSVSGSAPPAAAPMAPAAAEAAPAPAPSPVQQAPEKRKRAADDDVMDKEIGGGAPAKAATKGSIGASAGATLDVAGGKTRGGGDMTAKNAPPPPPPPPGGGGAGPSTGTAVTARAAESATADAPKMTPAEADKAATDLVLKHDKALKACLTKDAQAVSVTIKVAANGTATAVVTAKAPVPAAVSKCIKAAVAKMAFAKAATTVSLELSR